MNQAEAKFGASSDRLQQQVGGGDQIALQLQIAGEFEPAVGNHIAGGQEQARGHAFNTHRIISAGERSVGREASHR